MEKTIEKEERSITFKHTKSKTRTKNHKLTNNDKNYQQFNILYTNANGITGKTESLNAILKVHSTDIATIVETKLTNNNEAVTHKLGGTQGGGMKSWNMDWEAPNTGAGAVTFWGAFIEGNMNGVNSGDIYHSATLTVNEAVINSVNNLSEQNDFTFNTAKKTIESNTIVSLHDPNGKLVLTTNKKITNISHLKKGIYILKSKNHTQKIILN